VIVQIYGVTTPEDAAEVCVLGPDHVGVVLDEGIETWDSVDRATARAIVAELKSHVAVVALSLSTDITRIRRTIEELEADIVHLARAADGLAPEVIASLREMVAPTQLMTTVPVRGFEALAMAKRLEACSDFLLLDTAHPATGVVGATGYVHDWALSSAIVRAATKPVVLAGGLGPDNVAEAIRQVKPSGVDSETRTSRRDDRRRKDLDAVKRFIETARRTPSSEPNALP
jgi:phosphoribosylanthranilate isomerase